MKDEELTRLVRRIYQELEELERILGRIQEGWDRSRRNNDDYYLDGVALNLHGFYSGFERISAQIAETDELRCTPFGVDPKEVYGEEPGPQPFSRGSWFSTSCRDRSP